MVKTVKKTSKTSGDGGSIITVTSYDKVFLAAEIEIFGSITHSIFGEGTQYQYYKKATANRYKMPKWNPSFVTSPYFERSSDKSNAWNFCIVDAYGEKGSTSASTAFGIAPNLCI